MDRVLFNSKNRITQKYSSKHKAVDLSWDNNENYNIVLAHSKGVVEKLINGKNNNLGARGLDSYGNYILINHNNGYKTRYAHLKKDSFLVKQGDTVDYNTKLAIIGDSGNAYGRHLHFEVYKNNNRINPIPYLNKDFLNSLFYQAHDNTHGWLDKIEISHNPKENYNNYAGYMGYPIDLITIDNYEYRVHDIKSKTWSKFYHNGEICGTPNSFIDGIQIKDVIYRVHLKNGKWLPWVKKVDDTNNGYAGIYGKVIDAIQIKFKED